MGDSILKVFQLGPEGPYTSGSGSVYNGGTAVAAIRRLAVEEGVMFDTEPTYVTPIRAGTYAAVADHILEQLSVKGKIPAYVYPDDLHYLLKMIVSGSPTYATLPTTPTVLLAATALSGGGNSLTTQPNATTDTALGKILQLTLANASASSTAVTLTVTGTSVGGAALSEQVAFTNGTQTTSASGGGAGALSCTLWTKNYFATVSSITSSAQPVGDTLAVAGIDAFKYTFSGDMGSSTLYSMTGEYVDGTACWQIIGMILSKLTLTMDIGKSFKVDGDVEARQKVALAGSTGSVNPSALAGDPQARQNLADTIAPAVSTTLTRFYADPQGTAPGTTAIPARLLTAKLNVDNNVKLGKAADGTPYPTYVGRSAYGDKLGLDFDLLFNSYLGNSVDPTEVAQFLTNASRTLRLAFGGGYLPTGAVTSAANWPAALQDSTGKGGLYGIMVDISGRYTKMNEKAAEGRMAQSFSLASEYEYTSLNTALQVTLINRLNPNM